MRPHSRVEIENWFRTEESTWNAHKNKGTIATVVYYTYSSNSLHTYTKYQPLLTNITDNGWIVAPLIVLASGARATTHIPSMKALETQLKLPTTQIKNTFKQLNIIATQYAHSILIHKRRLENKQPINLP